MVIFHSNMLVYQRVQIPWQTRDAFVVRQMIDLWLPFLKMVIFHVFLVCLPGRVSLLFSPTVSRWNMVKSSISATLCMVNCSFLGQSMSILDVYKLILTNLLVSMGISTFTSKEFVMFCRVPWSKIGHEFSSHWRDFLMLPPEATVEKLGHYIATWLSKKLVGSKLRNSWCSIISKCEFKPSKNMNSKQQHMGNYMDL